MVHIRNVLDGRWVRREAYGQARQFFWSRCAIWLCALSGPWYGVVIDLAAFLCDYRCAPRDPYGEIFRVLYALGRDGLLPIALGRTHPTHNTPHVAIIVYSIGTLIVGLAAGLAWGTDKMRFGRPRVSFVDCDVAGLHYHERSTADLCPEALSCRVLAGGACPVSGHLVPYFSRRHLAKHLSLAS